MKLPYRVLICGARDWGSMSAIERTIKRLKIKAAKWNMELIIIEGGAPGADTMARIVGHKLDVHIAEVKALWDTRHRSAGPQRNTAMLMLDPHLVVAFHRDISKSKGTKDMVKQAEKAGIKVQVIKK